MRFASAVAIVGAMFTSAFAEPNASPEAASLPTRASDGAVLGIARNAALLKRQDTSECEAQFGATDDWCASVGTCYDTSSLICCDQGCKRPSSSLPLLGLQRSHSHRTTLSIADIPATLCSSSVQLADDLATCTDFCYADQQCAGEGYCSGGSEPAGSTVSLALEIPSATAPASEPNGARAPQPEGFVALGLLGMAAAMGIGF